MDRVAVERQLRSALAGRRLVAEIDLEGSAFDEVRDAVRAVILDGNGPRIDRIAPATFVTYLVGLGVRSYDGGFWPAAAEIGVDADWARPAFIGALHTLGLPDYAEETVDGFEYIAKILFHGGIPSAAAAGVLRLVNEALRQGEADAAEMVHAWRSTPSRLEAIQRPAQRFLLHGGAEATDLIDRVIELCRAKAEGRPLDPATLGLPSFWIEAMSEVGPAQSQLLIASPRPRVVIDLYGVDGPVLVLPPVDRSQGWSSWLVVAGTSIRHPDASAHRSLEVALGPASWAATLEASDGRKRTTSFDSNSKVRVWVFSIDGDRCRLARDQERVAGPEAIVLAPENMQFRFDDASGEGVPEPIQLPPLVGPWSGYRARVLSVGACARLWMGRQAEAGLAGAQATVPVVAARPQPRLEGEVVAGSETVDGWPVYADWPMLRLPDLSSDPSLFRYRMVIGGGRPLEVSGTVDQLATTGDGYRLDPGVQLAVADVMLDVIGPLGSDFRGVRFAVVQGGLLVEHPDRLYGPNEEASVSVALPAGVEFVGGGQFSDLVVPIGIDRVEASVQGTDRSTTLCFCIDRLLWTFRKGSVAAPFGSDRLTLGLDDIESNEVNSLLVRTGRPTALELCLLDGDRSSVMARADTSGEGARWAFPLARLLDTARNAQRARVSLELRVPGGRVGAEVAILHSKYEVADLEIDSTVDGDVTILDVRWQENRPFPGRCLRLWSVYRPWDSPVSFPVPDGSGPALLVDVDRSVPPAEYLAEVLVDDRWSHPVRPHRTRIDVVEVAVGTFAERSGRLRTLNTHDVRSSIELLLRGDLASITVSEELLAEAISDVMSSFVDLVAVEGKEALKSPSFRAMNAVLFQEPDLLPEALFDLVVEDRFNEQDLAVAAAALLPSALDCPFVAANSQTRDRMFEASPILGMAMDQWPADETSRDRWRRFLGWAPDAEDEHRLPDAPGPVLEPLLAWDADRLAALAAAVPEHLVDDEDLRGRRGALTFGGYVRAVLAWLREIDGMDDLRVKLWRSAYSGLNDRRVRSGDAGRVLEALTAQPSYQRLGKYQPIHPPAVLRFPPDVLAAAIHVTKMPEPTKAIAALWDASRIAPDLVTWACLMAIALHKSPN